MMKKADLLFCCFLLIALSFSAVGRAQTFAGIGGGGGLTPSTGVRVALPLEVQLSEHVFLFGGPAFILRRNLELLRKLPANRDYNSAEISYLSLPIMMKIRLDWEPVRLYGLAGIEVNYGLRFNANGIEDYRLFRERIDFDEVVVNRLDGGFAVGAGIETDLHRDRRIFADLRYYLGVLDIDGVSLGEIYNEGVFVTLGLMMPLSLSRGENR
ncbi:porin family protein [Flavilitoribacter nigricans]|uniref:Outer membrane protein beta-barrel domain-containing protein n=1 Tax=Flavilitoribacter nigricans (strain ATCC 23147 / DSM 23189 / NBRC 102662 / NCIMB 1420 / SS-2) TaxID=1122177 RepID=A0A2D0NB09_FLAN2|nr:porin family protein [Flavilitoribacter nigricans]PHN05675.1 hypothetical protein CRP01_14430 [Flavilitoribacter nigricans DSM 23189 = NBRC 102662]